MWKNTPTTASMCSLNSCERIRPERARNPIQRLVWSGGAQFQMGYSTLAEEELSCNPRVALRRSKLEGADVNIDVNECYGDIVRIALLRLYEGRQYREAASFLLRLPCYTFKAALPDIPVDLIVESLPHSLSLLEAVYARLLELVRKNDSYVNETTLVRIEQQVLWRIVHHISTTENLCDARIWSKLLVTLSRLSPGSKKLLASRRRSLERAVEGLGKHGLVPANTNVSERSSNFTTSRGTFSFGFGFGSGGGSNGSNGNPSTRTTIVVGNTVPSLSPAEPPTTLVPLTAKLREELEIRLEAYKLALHRIESCGKQSGSGGSSSGGVGVVGTRSKAGDKQVRAASHQRQLSLKYSEVQQRLIDNQSLLNILGKPDDRNLEDLIAELRRRVERDKEALRQWNDVRKSSGLVGGSGSVATTKNLALAASLLQFSRACSVALRLMTNNIAETTVGHEDNGFGTKELNNNLRDDRFEGTESSSSAGYHTDDSCSPTPEPVVVTTMTTMGTSVNPMKILENAGGSYHWTTEQLTDRYVALYAHAHLHTLDALDALEALKDATDLKAKILFSVVVLSWRVAEIVQNSRRLEASRILNGCNSVTTTSSSIITLTGTLKPGTLSRNRANERVDDATKFTNELDDGMTRQLARFGHETGARQVAERVLAQLERTLYDFPCLKKCDELKRYALICSSLAWICLARENPLILDVAQGFAEFDSEIHARHHASPDPHGTRIIAVLWPGLVLSESSRTSCLYRAVVLTASSSHYAT